MTGTRGNKPRGNPGRGSEPPLHAPTIRPRRRNHAHTLYRSDDMDSVYNAIEVHVRI